MNMFEVLWSEPQAIEWGMQTDSLGRMIVDMMARLLVLVANTEGFTTLKKPGWQESTPVDSITKVNTIEST